jgi:hypothetical protein
MYALSNNDKYPFCTYEIGPGVFLYWEQDLQPYSITWTNRDYHCPGWKGTNGTATIHNPSNGIEIFNSSSYAYNGYGVGNPDLYLTQLGLGGRRPYVCPIIDGRDSHPMPVSISQIVSPSEMFAIADSRLYPDAATLANDPAEAAALPGNAIDTMVPGLFSANAPYPYPPRHGAMYNVACCDGHVQGMKPMQMFNPTNTAKMFNSDHLPHPEDWW